MVIGYARVSTAEQSLDLQRDALKKAGVEKVFEDIASGAKSERAGLNQALDHLRKGDVFVVWKLDRVGRSLPHLIETIGKLRAKGVEFRSLQEQMDTTTPQGMLLFHMMAALAEFERSLIRERTLAGLSAARARGRKGGRPKALNTSQLAVARELFNGKTVPVGEIAQTLGVSRATLYRHLSPALLSVAPIAEKAPAQ